MVCVLPGSPEALQDKQLCAYLTAVGVDPEKAESLVVAWKLKCKTMGEIQRAEFMAGWTEERCCVHCAGWAFAIFFFLLFGRVDTLSGMKTAARDTVKLLASLDNKPFAEFYRWLFDFYKSSDKRKTLSRLRHHPHIT